MALRRSEKQPSDPLHQKQKELLEQEEKLTRRVKELERLIQVGPKIAEAKEKKRREEIARSARSLPMNDTRLIDKRFDAVLDFERPKPRLSRRALKAEKRDHQLKFLALVAVLAFIIVILWNFFSR